MTDERSPGLSGKDPLSGREPMLSGRARKATADLRGAYFAGNMDGLYSMMTAAQQQRFRTWNIRLAHRFARRALPHYEAYRPTDERPRQAVDYIKQEPTVHGEAAYRIACEVREQLLWKSRGLQREWQAAYYAITAMVAAAFTVYPHPLAVQFSKDMARRSYGAPDVSTSTLLCVESTIGAEAISAGYTLKLEKKRQLTFPDAPPGIRSVREGIRLTQLRAAMVILHQRAVL